jgi:hypothetical protein
MSVEPFLIPVSDPPKSANKESILFFNSLLSSMEDTDDCLVSVDPFLIPYKLLDTLLFSVLIA